MPHCFFLAVIDADTGAAAYVDNICSIISQSKKGPFPGLSLGVHSEMGASLYNDCEWFAGQGLFLFVCFGLFVYLFVSRQGLYNPGYPKTHYVDYAI